MSLYGLNKSKSNYHKDAVHQKIVTLKLDSPNDCFKNSALWDIIRIMIQYISG